VVTQNTKIWQLLQDRSKHLTGGKQRFILSTAGENCMSMYTRLKPFEKIILTLRGESLSFMELLHRANESGWSIGMSVRTVGSTNGIASCHWDFSWDSSIPRELAWCSKLLPRKVGRGFEKATSLHALYLSRKLGMATCKSRSRPFNPGYIFGHYVTLERQTEMLRKNCPTNVD
jgi:hypothetical protein